MALMPHVSTTTGVAFVAVVVRALLLFDAGCSCTAVGASMAAAIAVGSLANQEATLLGVDTGDGTQEVSPFAVCVVGEVGSVPTERQDEPSSASLASTAMRHNDVSPTPIGKTTLQNCKKVNAISTVNGAESSPHIGLITGRMPARKKNVVMAAGYGLTLGTALLRRTGGDFQAGFATETETLFSFTTVTGSVIGLVTSLLHTTLRLCTH